MEAEVMGMRMRSATRNAVRWMVLFLLLQYLGSHPSFTAAGEGEGHVTIEIVRYFNRPNSAFVQHYGGDVSYDKSGDICHLDGGLLSADQTNAAHLTISEKLRDTADYSFGRVNTYLGGDADHEATPKDPKKKCGDSGRATLNCIFKWNQGRFADASPDGLGIGFYRGTLYMVGVGSMNGYKNYWPYQYPHDGKKYLLLRMSTTEETQQSKWEDWGSTPTNRGDTSFKRFGVVCEVQQRHFVTTTTLPPDVEVPWAKKNWYVILIVVLLPVLAAVTISTVCFCRFHGGYDESKWLMPMVLREVKFEPLYALDRNDGIRNGDSQMMRGYNPMLEAPMAFPSGQGFEVPKVIKREESVVYDDGDVV
ncbi:hypothetical protein MOQ_006795 [Trypanosoma cruzi marinkellei]|uniref:Uncharacterized protein n=1 Tax=Trypanosoma cruzi marinkellei TaxID=85056 RepID=K2M344_TRYCR|nr:hypothetical protein MOQ_006795 [Trypanosoma cruzi marinkellei]